jgi:hypothetical protein
LDRFEVEMSSKIYWGSTQTLSVWSVDVDSEASRKIRKNEHFESMLKHKWNAGEAHLRAQVVDKEGYHNFQSWTGSVGASGSVGGSGVTNVGAGESWSSQHNHSSQSNQSS